MKLRIQNLGPIGDATIDLSKKLTVFCGPNGTGKTWAAYVVYGISKRDRQMVVTDTEFLGAVSQFNNGLEAGSFTVQIEPSLVYDHSVREIDFVETNLQSVFPVAVDSRQDLFGDCQIRTGLTREEFIDRYTANDIAFGFSVLGRQIAVSKPRGGSSVTISWVVTYPAQIDFNSRLANFLVSHVLARLAFFPVESATIFPVERNSIHTFNKELSLRRQSVFDTTLSIHDVDQRSKGIFEFYASQATRYPQAVRDAMFAADDVANTAKTASQFYDFAKEAELELLKGAISVGTDGEVSFASKRAEGKRFSFQLSSSAVKTISDLILYLKHQAQPDDLIIIDEPELNLHPDNQILLARLFARMINKGLRLLISTHSDYIVRELNNLIMLAEPEPALKQVAEEYGYREDEKISREDVGVYLFHFKNREKIATVESVPVEANGFEIKTIEDTLNQLNEVSQEIYYTMRYGAEQVPSSANTIIKE